MVKSVWKFQDSCITQILCEINFRYSRKSGVFAFLEAVNFVILVNYSGLDKSAKILQNPNSDPKMC